MKFFQSIQRTFSHVGIDPSQSKRIHPFNARNWKYCLIDLLACMCTIGFLFHEANSVKERMDGAFLTGFAVLNLICYTHLIFKMEQVYNYIDNVEKVVEQRLKVSSSKALYKETNQLIEKISEIIHLIVAKLTPILWIVPKSILCIFLYFYGNFEKDAFELPFPNWFPFNHKNLTGYLIAVALECQMCAHILYFAGGVISFGVGCYVFTINLLVKDIKKVLKSIDNANKRRRHGQPTIKKFSEFFQLHSKAKQFVYDFSEIYQPMFMILFLWSLTAIGITLFMIQIQMINHEVNFVTLVTISYMFYAFGIVFVVCELGERASSAYVEIGAKINELNWYLFPKQTQQMLPIIVILAHQPVSFECFASVLCNRAAFESVIKTGFSYFMMLHRLNK